MTKLQKDKFMYHLAGLTITYAFMYLTMLLFVGIPPENKEVVNILSGPLILSSTGFVYSYFFGSTKGSAEKTDIIANSRPVTPNPQPPTP